MNNVFFARRVHPKNPKRIFYWGDSLEPNFLQVINCGHYEQTIEKVFKVNFLNMNKTMCSAIDELFTLLKY